MPMQTSRVTGFNFDKALAAHANDETDYGQDFSRLPGGISGGVAKVISLAIGTYKTGQYQGKEFFRAAATVLEPVTAVETVKVWKDGKVQIVSSQEKRVQGLQTSIMIPLCDSGSKDKPVSADENVADMLNELRKIGGDEFTQGITSKGDLLARMEALVEAGPYIRFGTRTPDPTAQYPEPRTFESWYGSKGLENYAQPEGAGMVDHSPAANGQATAPGGAEFTETDDLASLVSRAEGADETAQEKLQEMALAAGVSQEDIDSADGWQAVADLINGGAAPGEGEDEAPDEPAAEEPWEPHAGEVYKYKPVDKKTGKPIKKSIEVEVKAVNKRGQTVDLLSLVDRKTQYKAVKWADLDNG